MSKKTIKINQGIKFSGSIFWIGIAGIILSIILLFIEVHWSLSLFVGIIAILMVLSIKLIEIDKKHNIFRYVIYVFPFKFGEWELVSDYSKLVLEPKGRVKNNEFESNLLLGETANIRNYNVYLEHELTKDKDLVLYTSKSIEVSRQILAKYSDRFNIQSEDRVG